MRQKEQRLWDTMKRNVPNGIWLQRIENLVGDGIPDVLAASYTRQVWFELKAPNRPKRKTTRLLGAEGARISQINWHIKAQAHGIETYFLIRCDGDIYLIDGRHARDLNELSEVDLRGLSVAYNWDEVWEVMS